MAGLSEGEVSLWLSEFLLDGYWWQLNSLPTEDGWKEASMSHPAELWTLEATTGPITPSDTGRRTTQRRYLYFPLSVRETCFPPASPAYSTQFPWVALVWTQRKISWRFCVPNKPGYNRMTPVLNTLLHELCCSQSSDIPAPNPIPDFNITLKSRTKQSV